MQVLGSRRCVKKSLLSQKNMKDRIKFLAEYGVFQQLCGVMNQDFSCMLMLPERCVQRSG